MTNPYLEGNFAPVTEEVTVTDLEVRGTLPEQLTGRYLRNGPNPIEVADPERYHWFTGDGMVHGLRLDEGRASWYRNRWVRSARVAEALGEPTRPGPVHERDFAANTNVIGHAGRTFAIVEAGSLPYEMTEELETVGPTDLGGLEGGYTAHPKRDPASGELHAMSYYWGWGNKVSYSVVGGDGSVRSQRFIDTTGSPMVHDMALTERYAVVFDLPVVFDLDEAMAGSGMPYLWNDDYPARLGFVARDGGDVRWFDVDPCYVFHPMNAFDDGDEVVIDVVRWDRMFDHRGHQGPFGSTSSLRRWTVDTVDGKVREELLDDRNVEFPRVDERLVGRPHRYGYAAVQPRLGQPGPAGILKVDTVAGTTEVVDLGVTAQDEAVFVPREPGADEDDGWLLNLAYDAGSDTSRLLVHHAQDLAGGPVAEVVLPVRVPYGFHGNWVPDA